jgi:hypothetical protein
VFANAGRRAGRRAVHAVNGPALLMLRGLPPFARKRLGFAIARRAVKMFDALLVRDGGRQSATILEPPSALSTVGGAGCGFYGSGMAEILRAVTDFDGALFHVRCRSRGESVCLWSTQENAP